MFYESDGVFMSYDEQGTSRYRAFTHRNDGYPIGEGFDPQTQYTRQGRFDDIGNEVVSTDDDSPNGMQGSPAYRPATGAATTTYAILSNAAEGGGTDYVRMTDDKIDFIDEARANYLPDVSDVQPVPETFGVIPDVGVAGEILGTEDDILAVSYTHLTLPTTPYV